MKLKPQKAWALWDTAGGKFNPRVLITGRAYLSVYPSYEKALQDKRFASEVVWPVLITPLEAESENKGGASK